ncbi:hypothetical protein DM860_017165 [Cuscuta australis]|uniref:NAB domain-containing protein n=1 Tax=Cuscuta australis TaxID=267555 RepID=A0A328DTT7_9ASTE|nr:hypothetical protein DM860_017165 [Cuscuta australis]
MDTEIEEQENEEEEEEGQIIVETCFSSSSYHSTRRGSFGKPSWLLCSIADLDERMKVMGLNLLEEGNDDSAHDSFAKRADSYYQQRPQLLALLQDLYNSYLSLADRYCHSLAAKARHPSPLPFADEDLERREEENGVIDSSDDAESSLSYQPPQVKAGDPHMIVAEFVMRAVESDIILHELELAERRGVESSRKMELQRSLVDVLESERLILLNENARLGYQVSGLVEENKGLASESAFMKRKAAELARCLLKMREDHRVFVLSRKLEDLQGQIHGLERRNREYYAQLVKHRDGAEKTKTKKKRLKGCCFQVHCDGDGVMNRKMVVQHGGCGGSGLGLWERFTKMFDFDLFNCGPHSNP